MGGPAKGYGLKRLCTEGQHVAQGRPADSSRPVVFSL